MAKTKGHTPIPNELLEAICLQPFTLSEIKVLLAMIRLILGWKSKREKRKDHISNRRFSKLTGLTPAGVRKGLKRLQQRGIIRCEEKGAGRRSSYWEIFTSPKMWIPVEGTPVPSKKKTRGKRSYPLRDRKTPPKEAQNSRNGPRGHARTSQGDTPVPSNTAVEGTPVPHKRNSSKETYLKERRAVTRLASLIEKTFQTFLHDPDFKLNDDEVEIIKGVSDRYSTSSPEQLITSFRNFLGCQEKIERKTIPIWAPQAGTYLATQSKHDGFRQAGSMARMPRARATE